MKILVVSILLTFGTSKGQWFSSSLGSDFQKGRSSNQYNGQSYLQATTSTFSLPFQQQQQQQQQLRDMLVNFQPDKNSQYTYPRHRSPPLNSHQQTVGPYKSFPGQSYTVERPSQWPQYSDPPTR